MTKEQIERILMKALYRFLWMAVSLLFLSGCATTTNKPNLEESLRTVADEYWKLRLDEKFEETYKMEDDQGLPQFEKYRAAARAMKRIQLVSISVKAVSVDSDKGDVDLDWRYRLTGVSKPFKEIIKDQWTYKNGKWRHVFGGK